MLCGGCSLQQRHTGPHVFLCLMSLCSQICHFSASVLSYMLFPMPGIGLPSVKNPPANADVGSINGSEDPWSRKWQPTPMLWPGKFYGQRSLMAYSPWGCAVRHDWARTHAWNAFPSPISHCPLNAFHLLKPKSEVTSLGRGFSASSKLS